MTNQKELIITRVFDLPINQVWSAWTEPESCRKWWGPKDFTCPSCTIDLKPGGKYLSCMRSTQGDEYWSTGVFKEIVPYKKLVMTDSFSDNKGNVVPASDLNMPGEWPLELQVSINFTDCDGKTKMELHHTGLPPEILNDCETSWQQSFDKLEEKLK
ncbi:SRPBCC family protein [Solitalea koreensis]|uniref:Uncharacterized conserved protein YndB, AHSA1/START domain n=1 Tax=Solitalea koreensis TaxID=543615 RepID=A0A521C3C9_9SPHI|nr:SRPBCC domain-containing protein [Solitalea koreensis]SMO53845.1 Uncharacterized conserved protein YndB, AHSA1/START domain [Solitalea koreensis]